MITIEELKEKIESIGYIATEELLYDTYNALCMFNDGKINAGQDIFAICLEGPPGAGKTEFAKTYTKVCKQIFNNNVEMVDYQCDATTGKTELFEDINISAAIRGDADNVNIPGKLIEAIKKVNSGKKVILFIDEYDKAREETDAFLLQFLQSGKINSTQHGDLEVKEEYKTNLQVILCKNDMREELSGPLSRRIRITRLDYMEPSTFYEVANRTLVKNKKSPVDDGLLNLVSLMYQHAYESKDVYDRLPSCSEMLIAIEDADRLLKRANAPQYIIYNTLVRNMFKSVDDIKTFEKSLDTVRNQNDSKLSALVKSMKTDKTEIQKVNLNNLIAQKVFEGEGSNLAKKTEEMQQLIDEYRTKFKAMEEVRIKTIEEEKRKILLENGKLVSSNKKPLVIKNFDDESALVKRGYDIFDLSYNDWNNVASINIESLSHIFLVKNLINSASQLGIKIYENGVLLSEKDDVKLILVNTTENNKSVYKIMCSELVMPSVYLKDIVNFINFATEVYNKQYRKEEKEITGTYSINTLLYEDVNKKDNQTIFNDSNTVKNVYFFENNSTINDLSYLKDITTTLSCEDFNNVKEASREIKGSEKKKVLTNE